MNNLLTNITVEAGVKATIATGIACLYSSFYKLNNRVVMRSVIACQIALAIFQVCIKQNEHYGKKARAIIKMIGSTLIGAVQILALRQAEVIAKKGTIALSALIISVIVINLAIDYPLKKQKNLYKF